MSNWNISNVENMNEMFYNCNSLVSLQKISNWKTSQIYDKIENNDMLGGYDELKK